MKLRAKHTCNTPQNAFGVGMRIASPKHIKVLHIDKDGKRTKLGYRDYTVEATSYPTDGAVVKTSKSYKGTIVIQRDVPLQRDSNYAGMRAISGDLIESDLERINEQFCQIHEVLERCIAVPHGKRTNLDAVAIIDKVVAVEKQVEQSLTKLSGHIATCEQLLSNASSQAIMSTNSATDIMKVAADVHEALFNVTEQAKEVNRRIQLYDGEQYTEVAQGKPGQVLVSLGGGDVEWHDITLDSLGLIQPKDTMSASEIRKFIHRLMQEFK